MTCFNRRDQTLRSLNSLVAQNSDIPRSMHVFLVDDASSDGTREAVAEAFPEVTIILGTGQLYWNRGMRAAFDLAMKVGFDGYLWLNNDTELLPDALDKLLRFDHELRANGIVSILAGSTLDPTTIKRSYGGLRRVASWNRIRHFPVQPSDTHLLPCDTMNGNCTFIPAPIAARLGNLEPRFQHHFGDIDYGYRANNAGFTVYIVPGYVGYCPRNTGIEARRDPQRPFLVRWKEVMSPKGYRFPEWLLFSRRHFSYLWPIYFLSPYLQTLFPRATRRFVRNECSNY